MSIIVPVYNSGATVLRLLSSLEQQRFIDHEIIFIDALSGDCTVALIQQYALDHPHLTISVISENDRGIYDAMNKGITMANGQWLYFIGADDRLATPNVLNAFHNAIKTDDTDLVYGNVTGELSKKQYRYPSRATVLGEGIHHQSIFYRSKLFEHTGKYDLRFRVAADYHLTLKVFVNQQLKTKYLDEDIAIFGESGLSSTQWDIFFYSYHFRFLTESNVHLQLHNPVVCLEKSLYCCYQLAMRKVHLAGAWSNAIFYLRRGYTLDWRQRLRILMRMFYWTLRPVSEK